MKGAGKALIARCNTAVNGLVQVGDHEGALFMASALLDVEGLWGEETMTSILGQLERCNRALGRQEDTARAFREYKGREGVPGKVVEYLERRIPWNEVNRQTSEIKHNTIEHKELQ